MAAGYWHGATGIGRMVVGVKEALVLGGLAVIIVVEVVFVVGYTRRKGGAC